MRPAVAPSTGSGLWRASCGVRNENRADRKPEAGNRKEKQGIKARSLRSSRWDSVGMTARAGGGMGLRWAAVADIVSAAEEAGR